MNNNPQTVWILWGAFLVTLPIYAGIGVVLGGSGELDPTTVLILYGCSLMQATVWAIIPMVLKKVPPLQRFLVRCAVAESVGIIAFLLASLGATLIGWLPLFVVAVLLMLASYPKNIVAA